MRVALMIEGQEGVTWDDWCALAAACEEQEIGALFSSDHYLSQLNEARNVSLDAWTVLAGLAARTTRLRLGTMVSPVTYRAPALLANAAATVDHISGGRVELGLGAGWMEREHRAYGFPFPDLRTRLAMVAEQLEIVDRLWTEERVDFHGDHYALDDAPAQPKPVQRPHPPLIVGGSGRLGTLTPALRFADEYNVPFVSPDELAAVKARAEHLQLSVMTTVWVGETRGDALERARALYGSVPRTLDFDAWLERYRGRAIVGSLDEVATRLDAYAHAGCDRVLLQHLLHRDLDTVRLVGVLGQQLG